MPDYFGFIGQRPGRTTISHHLGLLQTQQYPKLSEVHSIQSTHSCGGITHYKTKYSDPGKYRHTEGFKLPQPRTVLPHDGIIIQVFERLF